MDFPPGQNVRRPRRRAFSRAGKRIVGRKRGIITETLGLLPAVIVTAASAGDNTIGLTPLDRATDIYPTLSEARVDAGFGKKVVEHGAALGVDVEVVTEDPPVKGFSVIKRRWVVERTIGRLMQHRRLARDYETLPETPATMIRIAMIENLTRRAPLAESEGHRPTPRRPPATPAPMSVQARKQPAPTTPESHQVANSGQSVGGRPNG